MQTPFTQSALRLRPVLVVRTVALAVLGVVALAAAPAAALAASGNAAAAQYTTSTSELPFTGFELAAVLVSALVLLSGGLVIRRTVRGRHTS